MTDQKSHSSSAPKSNLSPQVNSKNARETLPPSSASNKNNMASDPGNAAPPVSTLVDIYDSGAIDPVYQAKSHAISCAIQEIGMGRYQVRSPYCDWKTPSTLAEKRLGISSGGYLLWLALGGLGTPFTELLPFPGPYLRCLRPTAIVYGL